MIKASDLQIGQTVYSYRDLDSMVERGEIESPVIEKYGLDSIPVIRKVQWKYYVDENGNDCMNSYGTSRIPLSRVFLTLKEAYDAQKAELKEQEDKLKKEIVDLESLLKFPLNHNVRDGEYCSVSAQKIYKEACDKFLKMEYLKNKDS